MTSSSSPVNASISSPAVSSLPVTGSSSGQSIQTKSIPLLNSLNQTGSIKLDRSNFLLWKSLVLPALRGHRVDGYVLGTKICPPQYIPNEPATNASINPDFEDWIATDQIILSWLLSTMTVGIASQILHCTSSCELWKAVTDLMSAHSRSRVTMYKYDLQRTRKGSSSVEEYLTKMKNLADNLAMAGSPISEADLVTQTLAGLDAEYTPVVLYLFDKESITWIEAHSRLLSFERHLEHLNNVNSISLKNPRPMLQLHN
ncbi:hypothetical protein QN277_010122 [Acacia crassicarpa]|uniref:Retrotransposon Copia-like N-terminal domain-containing protein n=1 Tax=Acacia crassicarpa TaxID=499986 RepID=A0AAE1IMB6_9FABA|nr:hypothetical protein QN277_010122 [Acacia crassicarpa]